MEKLLQDRFESHSGKKLSCILIAAGSSSRLHRSKQLVDYHGQPLLEKSLELAKSITDDVYCVLGFDAEKIKQAISLNGIEFILNRFWESGMGSSISAGVHALSSATDAVMIMLCDQWGLTNHDLNQLKALWNESQEKIVASRYYDKKRGEEVLGAPVIFPQHFFSELKALRQEGAKKLLQQHRANLTSVYIGNAAYDLDTQEDYEFYKKINGVKS